MKIFSRLLILLGLCFFLTGVYFFWEENDSNRLAFKNYEGNFKQVSVSNPPVRITINDLGIDLPIFPAKVVNGKWETTTEGASYLLSSPLPGGVGNSIIYTHGWASLFGPLHGAKEGQKVAIVFADKTKKTFKIVSVSVVRDVDTQILDQTDDRRITLYTCAGFWDSERLVVTAIN